LLEGQVMAKVQNGLEHCRKFQLAEYDARTLQATDRFATAKTQT